MSAATAADAAPGPAPNPRRARHRMAHMAHAGHRRQRVRSTGTRTAQRRSGAVVMLWLDGGRDESTLVFTAADISGDGSHCQLVIFVFVQILFSSGFERPVELKPAWPQAAKAPSQPAGAAPSRAAAQEPYGRSSGADGDARRDRSRGQILRSFLCVNCG